MKFTKPILVATLAATFNLPVIAEEQSPIVVTATRTAQTTDSSLASVTVITQSDIERTQANSISELISGIVGIDTDTNGGLGQESNIYMRGTDKDHVLVLMNGIKFGSATTGRAALQYIPLSVIERIEIVRGPRSSLYGSEAIGGVIQIFTKKGKDQSKGFTKLTSGTFGTSGFAMGLNRNTENSSLNVSFDSIMSEGFDARVTKNTDDDGYENKTFNINYSYNFDNNIKLETYFLNSAGISEYDGVSTSATYHRDFNEQTFGAKTVLPVKKNWDMTIALTQSKDFRDSVKNDAVTSTYNTNRSRIAWQNDLTIFSNMLLTVGADKLIDKIDSTVSYPVNKRETKSLFAQNQWFGTRNDILVSLRQDEIEKFGKHSTGNVAWGNQLTQDTRVTASYGTAFKAPTFNELYHPQEFSSQPIPNPNLLAESSSSYEIGLAQKTLWGKWNINVFQTDIKNMIVFVKNKVNSNIDNARINGVELSADTNLNGWLTQLSASLLNPVNRDTGEWLDRRSKQTIKLSTDKTFGDISLGATLLSQGPRMDDGVRLAGYNIINLRVKKQVDKSTSISFKGNNVTDKEYQTIDGYRMARASYYISLDHQF